MKYTITIEEAHARDFIIEASSAEEAYDSAIKGYESGEFVLNPGECQFKQIAITKLSSESTEWQEFYLFLLPILWKYAPCQKSFQY